MSKTITPEATTDETAEIKEAIRQLSVKLQSNHEQMQRDQEEIERLKARTRARLEQMKVA